MSRRKLSKKKRGTEYSKITKLIDKFGFDQLRVLCMEQGIYCAAKKLTALWGGGNFVNYTTVSYMRKKFGWKRVISSREDPNVKSVLNGKIKIDHFKIIEFSEDIINEVFQKYKY